MLNILLVMLGCNIESILLNRIDTSINFIDSFVSYNQNQNYNPHVSQKTQFNTKFTWFLSGGIKNNFVGAKSEASIMQTYIGSLIKNLSFPALFDYVLDEKSTNTAENFIQVSKYLNTTSDTYDTIYIITSDYHYERANKMLNSIDSSRNYEWVLGDLEQTDSRYWEKIHMKNILSDVKKAKKIFSYHN